MPILAVTSSSITIGASETDISNHSPVFTTIPNLFTPTVLVEKFIFAVASPLLASMYKRALNIYSVLALITFPELAT